MLVARLSSAVILAFFCVCSQAQEQPQKITVTGTLDHPKTARLEKLNGKCVTATGTISHPQGVETGDRAVLIISSIKETKATTHRDPRAPMPSTSSVANGYWKTLAAAE